MHESLCNNHTIHIFMPSYKKDHEQLVIEQDHYIYRRQINDEHTRRHQTY